MRKTYVKRCILGMLRECGECYGLELAKAHGIKSGSIYPALEQLRQEGWVSVRYERHSADLNRPIRKFYRLTPLGREQFEKWS